jgi:hypothetical protein
MAQILSVSPIAGIGKMVIGEGRNFPELARYWHEELVAPMLALMGERIAAAQASGEVRPGDPRLFAVQIVSPFLMAMLWRETFVPVGATALPLEALAAQHLAVLKAGLLLPRSAT